MRINHSTQDNPKVESYANYILYAILIGVFFYFFLNIVVDLGIVLFQLGVKYYWASILIVLVIIFLKRKKKK